MNFEWDPGKARQNRRKHRVSFEEAATVFGDPLAITYPDGSFHLGAAVYHCRNVERQQVLIVAHTDRDENIRIINARKTTQRERKHYEEYEEKNRETKS